MCQCGRITEVYVKSVADQRIAVAGILTEPPHIHKSDAHPNYCVDTAVSKAP